MEIDPKNIDFTIGEAALHSSSEEHSHKSDNDSSSRSASTDDERETSTPSDSHHLRKWRRLRKHYNDQYLELFNDYCNHDPSSEDTGDLRESQFGAVVWTSNEKKKLFAAVAKSGRHDLTRLTDAVATKSAVEILSYLGSVHQAQVDRQLFRTHPKNISMAEIPAAYEIGPECEADLEKAADALNAYQEQYDIAAGQTEGGLPWLIDHVVAAQLDEENENTGVDLTEELEETSEEPAEQQTPSYQKLFHLEKMLEASELFFMNHSVQSSYPHWKTIAEHKQRPAMTSDCLQTFHDLVMEQLRQILKISIQVANARLSSMTTNGYSPSWKLNHSDVATALNILDMPHDAWDFWARMPRRNGQHVITGSHSKGEARGKLISYESAEAVLFPRRGRGRRRSVSIGSEASSGPDVESAVEDFETIAESVKDSSSEADEASDVLERQSDFEQLSSTDSEALDKAEDKRGANRGERKLLLEETLEQYVEKLDQAARSVEEAKLWQILGKRQNVDAEEAEEHQLGPRPKSLRKTQEELSSWSYKYVSEWEYYGSLLPTEGPGSRDHDSEAEAKRDRETTNKSN